MRQGITRHRPAQPGEQRIVEPRIGVLFTLGADVDVAPQQHVGDEQSHERRLPTRGREYREEGRAGGAPVGEERPHYVRTKLGVRDQSVWNASDGLARAANQPGISTTISASTPTIASVVIASATARLKAVGKPVVSCSQRVPSTCP